METLQNAKKRILDTEEALYVRQRKIEMLQIGVAEKEIEQTIGKKIENEFVSEQEIKHKSKDNPKKEINTNEKKKQSTKKYITLFGTITNVVKGGCGFIKCDDPLETGIYVFTETKKIHKGNKVKFRTMNITKGDKQHFQKATNVRLVRETTEKQVSELLL